MRSRRIEEPVFRSLEILTWLFLGGCTVWITLLRCGISLQAWLH
jgi:hypothetical protein